MREYLADGYYADPEAKIFVRIDQATGMPLTIMSDLAYHRKEGERTFGWPETSVVAAWIKGTTYVEVPDDWPFPLPRCSQCGVSEGDCEWGSLIDVSVITAKDEEGFAYVTQLLCDRCFPKMQVRLTALGFLDHRHGGINYLEDYNCCGGVNAYENCPTPSGYGQYVVPWKDPDPTPENELRRNIAWFEANEGTVRQNCPEGKTTVVVSGFDDTSRGVNGYFFTDLEALRWARANLLPGYMVRDLTPKPISSIPSNFAINEETSNEGVNDD